MDGILNINKPAGITSFGVVSLTKRLTKEKRVGHAGTLDPIATGVLPVCLGQGTRIVEFLADAVKTYRAEIELGVSTDTYDSEGAVIRRSDPSSIARPRLDSALDSFRGTILQVPPLYSALKHQGRPLYEFARAGVSLELSARPVTIYKLKVIEWLPPFVTLEVSCSKGTYIRSLANDLGEAVGCGAYLKNLVRTGYGVFDIKNSVTLAQFEEAAHNGAWQKFLHPVDSALRDLTAITVSDEEAADIRDGKPVAAAGASEVAACITGGAVPERSSFVDYCRAYAGGVLLAVLRLDAQDGLWHPYKVFHQ